ncbi:MAG: nucleotidyltransferase family protein [Acidimicrobiales bacterium]
MLLNRQAAVARGRLVAACLYRSWRESPPPPEVTIDELESVAPLLVSTGAGGLAWRRVVRDDGLAASRAGAGLHSAWLVDAGRSAGRDEQLVIALEKLRLDGLEPVVLKGWAASRRYPTPGLRPSGDIDLCLRAEDIDRARRLTHDVRFALDFAHIDRWSGLTAEGVLSRASTVDLNGCAVKVPAPADDLHLLAMHLLKHGGWRPLWLCDVAVLCESEPQALARLEDDREMPTTTYVRCVVAAAHVLLGARPAALEPTEHLPGWAHDAFLREWGTSPYGRGRGPVPPPWRARRFLGELRGRMPNELAATVSVMAPLQGAPRWLLQGAAYGRMVADYSRRTLMRR